MSGQDQVRERIDIMGEILSLTKEMAEKRDNSDFLVLGVDHRQDLMDEFDLLASDPTAPILPDQDYIAIRNMAKEILELDKIIKTSLDQFQKDTKQNISKNNQQQKIMGYVNNAISSQGSYMDYKK